MERSPTSQRAAPSTGSATTAEDAPNLFAILTSADPQTQLMSMALSLQALEQGAQVHILLCGPAGDLALVDAPASATAPQKPKGMSPQGLMQKIIAKGAAIEVCAIYLPNKGVGPEALLAGVTPAQPPEVAARLLAPDTRILSL